MLETPARRACRTNVGYPENPFLRVHLLECVSISFRLRYNFFRAWKYIEKSCGSLFFFSVSKRLLPKSPKNEVLVAAEPAPGSTCKTSLKKQMLVKTGPKLTSLLCQSTKHPNQNSFFTASNGPQRFVPVSTLE